jgi:hypothetical protein
MSPGGNLSPSFAQKPASAIYAWYVPFFAVVDELANYTDYRGLVYHQH